jgi:hypothetical protein
LILSINVWIIINIVVKKAGRDKSWAKAHRRGGEI